MTRVMIVDDHPMWREGVARDLGSRGYDVCATASDSPSAVRIALATRPDVVVMDLQLGAGSGVDATREITAALPDTRVLVLSASAEQTDVLAAVKNGASGYLVKSASLDEFDDAVRRTGEGDAVFSAGLAGLLLGEYHRIEAEPKAPQLTERETEVLRLVARGLTAKQIAARLVLSHRTVENHVQNTLRKLQLHNRAELVRYAIEHGLDEVTLEEGAGGNN
ncbi:response regulator transcription factor [Kribbella sp. NBC_01245]|uniref:response regulator transcription factor n=1 Tax=Kribbella sp. NBC_01245 TaxID=2903578 RepID=UPI002E2DFAF1|nr:response regulator transcription factor [Kribbella sp. NBC_01245]